MSFDTARRMEALPFSGIRVMMERANRMQREGKDIIHMEIGRPDFDTPEVIKKAAFSSLEKGNVFYTSNYGTPELRAAIAEKLTRENGIDYSPSSLLVPPGRSSRPPPHACFSSHLVIRVLTSPPWVCKKPRRKSHGLLASVFLLLNEVPSWHLSVSK